MSQSIPFSTMDKVNGHTPGPWKVENGKIYGRNGTYITRDVAYVPDYVARMDASTMAPVEQSSNARLIAAAPDMLAALHKALELATVAEGMTGCRSDDDFVWGIRDAITDAIAKATQP